MGGNHALLRLGPLQRFERALDGDGLGEREVLAAGVLREFAAHDLTEVDRYRRVGNRLPAEQFDGPQAALASDEMPVERDRNRLQQPDLSDAGGELSDVAEVAAVALADDNAVDGKRCGGAGIHGRSSGCCSIRKVPLKQPSVTELASASLPGSLNLMEWKGLESSTGALRVDTLHRPLHPQPTPWKCRRRPSGPAFL